jgi:hypothetical protein
MLGLSAPAMAVPKGPNGQKCDSSETNVKHDIKGKHYTCDKCVVSSCSTSGGQISNCTKTTYWSNCVEAAASIRPGGLDRAVNSGVMAPPKAGSSPKPRVNRPGMKMNKQ